MEQRSYYQASDMYYIIQRGDLGWVSKVFGKRLLKFEVSTKHNKIDEASSQQFPLEVLLLLLAWLSFCHYQVEELGKLSWKMIPPVTSLLSL